VSQSIIYAAMPVGALMPMPTFPPMDAMPPPPPNQPVRKKNKGKKYHLTCAMAAN